MSDEATFSKFIRFFTNRLVQTLVQVRLYNFHVSIFKILGKIGN